MSIQTFTSSSTWDWPEYITHVIAECWGGGGGCGASAYGEGGGGGGHYASEVIYRGSETFLTVTVGAGGVQAANGGDSKVTQSGVVVCKARGGNKGSGSTGGTSPSYTESVGVIRNAGGNGGNGAPFASGYTGTYGGGGGGGSGGRGAAYAGNNGTNALGPFAGGGGSAQPGGGAGGTGGTHRDGGTGAGSAGGNPGGGGGGGANAANGGSGHNGKVVLTWGSSSGHTRFSSGCCCGTCDLVDGQFPTNMWLNLAISDTNPDYVADFNDLYGPYVIPDYSITYIAEFGCDPGPTINTVTSPGMSFDYYVEDYSLVNLLDSLAIPLELTAFETGLGYLQEEITNYCLGTYEVPLADLSIDDGALSPAASFGFLGLHDRWFDLPALPAEWASWDSPEVLSYSGSPDLCGCESRGYSWERSNSPRLYALLYLQIDRTLSGKYFYRIMLDELTIRYATNNGNYDDCVGGTLPTIASWLTAELLSVSSPLGIVYQISNHDTAGYDTGIEALNAAKAAIGTLTVTQDIRHAEHGPNVIGTNTPYVVRTPLVYCGEDEGCMQSDNNTYVSNAGLQRFAGVATLEATLTW